MEAMPSHRIDWCSTVLMYSSWAPKQSPITTTHPKPCHQYSPNLFCESRRTQLPPDCKTNIKVGAAGIYTEGENPTDAPCSLRIA